MVVGRRLGNAVDRGIVGVDEGNGVLHLRQRNESELMRPTI
jgi:hypothetical protein